MYRIIITVIYSLLLSSVFAQVQDKKETSPTQIQAPQNTPLSACACNTIMQIIDTWDEMSPMQKHAFEDYRNYYQYRTMDLCESNPFHIYTNLNEIELTCRQAVNYNRTTPQTKSYQWSQESILKLEESKIVVPKCLCGK